MTWLAFYGGLVLGVAVGVCLVGLFSVAGEESRREDERKRIQYLSVDKSRVRSER